LGGLRSWHIGTHLAAQGYQVTAVVPGVDTLTGKRKEDLGKRLWVKERIHGVNVFWTNALANDRNSKLKRALYYCSSSMLQFFGALRVNEIDIVVTTSMPLPAVIGGMMTAWVRRVPFVIEVRDLTIDSGLEVGYLPSNWLTKAMLNIESWLFRRADRIIAVTQGMRDILVKDKGVEPWRTSVVPLGFEGQAIYNGLVDWSRDIRVELEIGDKFIVLYSGTLGYVFDIPTILRAACETRHRPDILYLFLGGGQNLHEFKAYAENQGIHCLFLGPRPKHDVPIFCAQADVCVYAIRQGKALSSILGNKVFDYLGNGKPVITASPKGDVQRLIETCEAGIRVPSADGQAMGEAILSLADDPERLKRFGHNARCCIHKYYQVKDMMRAFESSIAESLG